MGAWDDVLELHLNELQKKYPKVENPRLTCRFGFHSWVEGGIWAGRICKRCGRMEQMSGYSG